MDFNKPVDAQLVDQLSSQVAALKVENQTLKDILVLKDKAIRLHQHYYKEITQNYNDLKEELDRKLKGTSF